MKKAILAACLLAGGVVLILLPDPSAQPGAPKPPVEESADPAAAIEIFQQAFWVRPAAEDKILQALRRESTGSDGISQWQWFIVVEPSQALIRRLRIDNVFDLSPANAPPSISAAPTWFSFVPSDVEVFSTRQGNLTLLFSKSSNRLLATDHGNGFAPPAQ